MAEIRKWDSDIIVFDDYSVLKEIFELDNRIRTSTQSELIERLNDLRMNTVFITDRIEAIVDAFIQGRLTQSEYAFQSLRNTDASHNILDLNVWHEVLEILLSKASDNEAHYIFEFARGDAENYLKHNEIGPGESYTYHLLRLIKSGVNLSSCGIVYIKSDLESRINRSISRKAKGGHYLSPEIMKAVYKSDSFLNQIEYRGDAAFLDVEDLSIPVFVVDNSEDIPEESISNKFDVLIQPIQDYFSKHSALRP
ncbi:MAG: hypothetical protein JST90_17435 [Bacteroidetes bacterium]|nr:hypothetical protein [Bacteroidota bacterium]